MIQIIMKMIIHQVQHQLKDDVLFKLNFSFFVYIYKYKKKKERENYYYRFFK